MFKQVGCSKDLFMVLEEVLQDVFWDIFGLYNQIYLIMIAFRYDCWFAMLNLLSCFSHVGDYTHCVNTQYDYTTVRVTCLCINCSILEIVSWQTMSKPFSNSIGGYWVHFHFEYTSADSPLSSKPSASKSRNPT